MPWRPEQGFRLPRDPYRALVSEFMLQQTQVSRVLEYFPRFMAEFPRVHDLASASEQRVLTLWAGLGYYRRARNLHAAARAIVECHRGVVPRDTQSLRALPGVGRYTAGAIASIVFGQPEPAVDGNVTRVLLRVEGRDLDPAAKATADWTWKRAGELVHAASDPGAWNEGLMELGATVCLPPPARPRCDACPVARWCIARAEGTQGRIPRAKKSTRTRVEIVHSVVVVRGRGAGRAVLLEQRGPDGLWAGMWQPPCAQGLAEHSTAAALARVTMAIGLEPVGVVDHATTMRCVRFVVWRAKSMAVEGRRWVTVAATAEVPISNAHLKVLRAAGAVAASSALRSPSPSGAPRAARGSRRRA